MRCYVGGKLHGLTVTAAAVEYVGSVTIDTGLLAAAGIEAYEQVHVVNLNTGGRWVTYALPGEEGMFTLNGGGARLGVVGDRCVVMTYRWENMYTGARVVFCDQANNVTSRITYPPAAADVESHTTRPDHGVAAGTTRRACGPVVADGNADGSCW